MTGNWRLLGAALATLLMAAPVGAQDSFGDTRQHQLPAQRGYPANPRQPYPPTHGYRQPPSTQAPGAGYPRQERYPQQRSHPQGGYGGTPNLDRFMQMERQDFGVPPTKQLHSGPMHGPTPNSIPGGQLITTKGLVSLIEGRQVPYRLFDVLGGPETLPGAIAAVPAHRGGNFNDQTQREFSNFLQSVTGGDKQIPLVFYCLSPHCWMSYNASLRAIHMGYTNVLWYRGGIKTWKAAGQPVQSAQTDYAQ